MAQNPTNTGTPGSDPQAAATPRVHHPHTGTTQPQPGTIKLSDEWDLTNPYIAPYLRGALPPRLVVVGNLPRPAPDDTSPPPQTVMTLEQYLDSLKARIDAFKDNPDDVPGMLDEVIGTAFLLDGVDREAVRIDFPFNSNQVLAGGYAVLDACTLKIPEYETLKVDAGALGQELAAAERFRRLFHVLKAAFDVIDANLRTVLNAVAKRVDDGLGRAGTVIEANGALGRALEPAVAIRRDPSDQGQTTKAENARLREAGRTEGEQQVLQQQQAEAAKAPPATTVMLQQGTPVPATKDAPATTVAHRTGHSRKP